MKLDEVNLQENQALYMCGDQEEDYEFFYISSGEIEILANDKVKIVTLEKG